MKLTIYDNITYILIIFILIIAIAIKYYCDYHYNCKLKARVLN